ncbi:MAG: bifunctional folylpolyglutamate synthase/dihydrofolate synthase [Kiritimatiellae bacterium]|nr:bifunctional folylpolyglutamate synthase/dihydrofolate synthase [Kiritimatiellia bacterium]
MENDSLLSKLYRRRGGRTIRYDLETTRALLEELALSPSSPPSVHVAGTSGKGSTSAMAESVLRAAGLKTGLFTSPHLLRFEERIRVSGREIPSGACRGVLERTLAADARQAARPGAREGTFFELSTAAAWDWFTREKTDIAVNECGLGGRLDATNVISPLVCVITPIALEHTEWLGDTLEKIASEKGGIIAPGVPVVLAPQSAEAEEVLLAIARERGAPVFRGRETVPVEGLGMGENGQRVRFALPGGAPQEADLPLWGPFQLDHASAALAAAWLAMRALGKRLSPEAAAAGLSAVRWPGRCDWLCRAPDILLDVGHTPDEAEALAGFLRIVKQNRKILLVAGLLRDKDPAGYFRALAPVADKLWVLDLADESERAMPVEALATAAEAAGLPPAKRLRFGEAAEAAEAWARETGGIALFAGSFAVGAPALRRWCAGA